MPLLLLLLFGLGLALLLTSYVWVQVMGSSGYHDVSALPDSEQQVALVFGAGIRGDQPSLVLRDRITTAVDLYRAGKVGHILMSGDNRYIDYNEPKVMYDLAAQLGVPEEDMTMDFGGRSTYDSCYRARHIFGLESVVVVTNAYHQPRAQYVCTHLGLSTVGMQTDKSSYDRILQWKLREIPASIQAFWHIVLFKPEAEIMGDPEPIQFDQTQAEGT